MASFDFSRDSSSADTHKHIGMRLRFILFSVAVVALVVLLVVQYVLGGMFASFKPPQMPSNVVVTVAAPYTFEDKIEFVGTAKSNESAVISSTVTETVKAISFEEGAMVHQGDVLVELNDEEEQATLNEATRSYMRYNKLVTSNLGSVAQRDEELAAMEVAKAQLNKRKIVAPFDGVIGIREVSVGDLVAPGTEITTIDDIDPIKLDFSVPETYLPALKNGLDVYARSEAYPDTIFAGKIYTVDSRIDPDTRSIMVRALVDNGQAKLRPGLLMKVNIVRSSTTALAIPEGAVMSSGDRHYVYVAQPDAEANAQEAQDGQQNPEQKTFTVVEKTIETGIREPGYVEVVSGLSAGDKVIVEGQLKTGPTAKVIVAEERTIKQTNADSLNFAIKRKQEAIQNLETTEDKEEATE